ncbi:MAG: ABC transporter permease subunit [Oscillospiraceae bacterium]|uniref:ABC transporter permease subunit n=1 Tax=Intestinimonas massiliensis (ex Afouda et al. 2020) TaxID=1673721 RepID=A0AAW5JLQ2_9FIRM|nr:ABC transporter permease subunit [Intestinimonas massiliensis (ex Afouda et al. 2020)]MBS6283269.1 ABC transporter permease subunit [Oscillospiraceae bacterium]MCG4525812.1 ABC transporter permease subunit [Intestinimonas massiliensis (ex Afouda et al. 2020)]MCQ4769300.1 ABC transporter permease subunit [Intestinimonas massiliensis (ex Afouda et al. 2020)]MCQ4805868.1 ABC transporter permease subunit [Intestinimonas massiliensis (ex Afouda et al. 2020)]
MRRIGRVLLPVLFWLGVWQLAAAAVGQELLLPGPAAVGRRLLELAAGAVFWQTALASLLRIFGGLLLGVALGALLAGLTAWVPLLDWVLTPAVKVVRATPVASFILLVYLWVERGRVPGLISALMVLPVVWGNVTRGIAETDPRLLELARAYGFGRGRTLRRIYIPSVLPYFASGCRTALGLAWKAGVAAEVLCQPQNAIGTQIYNTKYYLETPSLFAWTLVVIALSFLLEWAVGGLLRRAEGLEGGRRP